MKAIVAAALVLLLPACGSRQALKPAPGESLPPAPATAPRAPTVAELLTPPPIARPERVDELLRRSETRPDDRFDLPPPGVPAGVIPIPTNDDDPD
jgi:hypothetical protein